MKQLYGCYERRNHDTDSTERIMEFNYPIIRNTLQTTLAFSDLATKW